MTSVMTSVMTSRHEGRHDVKPFLPWVSDMQVLGCRPTVTRQLSGAELSDAWPDGNHVTGPEVGAVDQNLHALILYYSEGIQESAYLPSESLKQRC